jgi:DnaJ-class molecular chaperone
MMEIAEAKKLLDVPDEFSPHALKSAFRRASFLKHPDAGGSQEEFIALMQAFDVLKPCATTAGASPEEMQTLTTVDGTPLADLGKGYPLTVSARTCEKCSGLGYKEFHETDRKLGTCKKCGGSGMVRYPCKKCGGSGDYKHPRTGRVTGKCYRCDGSGWFYPEHKRPPRGSLFGFFDRIKYIPGTRKRGQTCRACDGTGQVWQDVDVGATLYAICETCKGKGEVKMANPVIPRGYLAGGGK